MEWLREVSAVIAGSPIMFVSVDMRVFKYSTYGAVTLGGTCNSEEHLEYAKVIKLKHFNTEEIEI